MGAAEAIGLVPPVVGGVALTLYLLIRLLRHRDESRTSEWDRMKDLLTDTRQHAEVYRRRAEEAERRAERLDVRVKRLEQRLLAAGQDVTGEIPIQRPEEPS